MTEFAEGHTIVVGKATAKLIPIPEYGKQKTFNKVFEDDLYSDKAWFYMIMSIPQKYNDEKLIHDLYVQISQWAQQEQINVLHAKHHCNMAIPSHIEEFHGFIPVQTIDHETGHYTVRFCHDG